MTPFKTCPCCPQTWPTREAFLADPRLELIGYQVNFEKLELGLLLFNHAACRSTLAVHARFFRDMYGGPVFAERKTGAAECPRFCLRTDELGACAARCECAYIREILQIIRGWPKTAAGACRPAGMDAGPVAASGGGPPHG
jgi:hypothetical protein